MTTAWAGASATDEGMSQFLFSDYHFDYGVYPSDEMQAAEGFAWAVPSGPSSVSLLRELEDVCVVPSLDSADVFLNERVFVRYPLVRDITVELTRREIPGLSDHATVVTAGVWEDQIGLLVLDGGYKVVWVEPRDGVARITQPVGSSAAKQAVWYSDADHPMLFVRYESGRSDDFRVDPRSGELEHLDIEGVPTHFSDRELPPFAPAGHNYWRVGEGGWLSGVASSDVYLRRWVRGRWMERALPETEDWDRFVPQSLQVTDEGFVMSLWSEERRRNVLARYDEARDAWATEELPVWARGEVMPLGAGRYLMIWAEPLGQGTGWSAGPLVYDAEMGTFHLSEDPCGADRLSPGWTVEVEGALYRVEQGGPGGEPGVFVTHLEVSP